MRRAFDRCETLPFLPILVTQARTTTQGPVSRTFRARKAILCARCLHLRLKLCWLLKLSNKILS